MIRLETTKDRVAVVYLDNPPLNILTLEMTQRLISLFSDLETDDGIRVVIVTGAGEKAFCAGADIKEFAAVRDRVTEKKLEKENEALLKIEKLPKPVIAALNGITLGGGCEIALACDIRIIAENEKIGLPEIKLGVFPGSGGLYRLPRIVGLSNALEMMYTGNILTSVEAYRMGLVNHVVPPDEALSFAMELACKIAKHPAEALACIKEGVRKSFEISQEEAIRLNLELSERVFRSPDCEEGIRAFFEKRPPSFK